VAGKQLPLTIELGAVCKACGCRIDTTFALINMDCKPSQLYYSLCAMPNVLLRHARAVQGPKPGGL
jgi:hypothetical protein